MGSIGSRMQQSASDGKKKSKVNLEVRGKKISPKPRHVHREVVVVQPIRQQQHKNVVQSKIGTAVLRPKNTKQLTGVEGTAQTDVIESGERFNKLAPGKMDGSKVIEIKPAECKNRVDLSEPLAGCDSNDNAPPRKGLATPDPDTLDRAISDPDTLDRATPDPATLDNSSPPSPSKPEVSTPADLSDGCDVSMDEICSSSRSDVSVDLENMEDLPEVNSLEATNVSSLRIREVIKLMEQSSMPSSLTIVGNLKYAVQVLDFVYETETKRLCGEEDDNDLSEVNESAVPNEVKDWLAQTFTRSMSNIKRFQDKPKFRSVANAIRAGIMVDRIYRRMSSTLGIHVPSDVLDMLKGLDDWQFNVFSVNEASEGHSLRFVAYEVMQKYNLLRKFKISSQTLDNLLNQLEAGYSKYGNPYHNLVHAADVTQTTHHFLMNSGLQLWLSDIEVFAIVFASIIHDFEHTGTTNAFHINSNSDLALVYNDKSVLENHHSSSVFRLLKDEENNILSSFKREEYKEFRVLVIEMVLATDMSSHFHQIKTMKSLLSMPENIDKCKALSLMVHCADISHPGKPWALHAKWTDLLMSEYFKQGDREAELEINISPLCDRHNTLIAESQIGFIDFIVDPSFQVMSDAVDKILLQLTNGEEVPTSVDKEESYSSRYKIQRHWNPHLNSNKQKWKDRAQQDAEERARKEENGDKDGSKKGDESDEVNKEADVGTSNEKEVIVGDEVDDDDDGGDGEGGG